MRDVGAAASTVSSRALIRDYASAGRRRSAEARLGQGDPLLNVVGRIDHLLNRIERLLEGDHLGQRMQHLYLNARSRAAGNNDGIELVRNQGLPNALVLQ